MTRRVRLRPTRRERLRVCSAVIALVSAATLRGCAVGPDFVTPPPPEVARFTPERTASPGNHQRFVEGREVPWNWWRAFGSKPLTKLIQQAVDHNPTLEAAEAAIRVAHFTAEAQKGAWLPQLSGSSYSTMGVASNEAAGATAQPLYTLFTKQLVVSFTPAIWGGNFRGVESLEAQTEIQRDQLEAAYLTLTSNVVTAAIEEASLRAQIAAIKNIIGIEKDLLALSKRQLAYGAVSGVDVAAQETALLQAEEILPPLEKTLARQRDLLTALAGRYSSDEIGETFELGRLSLPLEVPLSLPSQLVARRPDIKAAAANVHSADALVGVAIAARLPNITLLAGGGSSALQFSQLFTPGTGFYFLAANAAQPIFDGMTLLNKEQAAEAGLALAEAQYRAAVINAFQNVSDALRALQSDAHAVKVAAKAEQTAKRSLDLVRRQARFGEVDQLAVLNAEQAYLQTSIVRVIAEATRLSDTAALFMALGGGW